MKRITGYRLHYSEYIWVLAVCLFIIFVTRLVDRNFFPILSDCIFRLEEVQARAVADGFAAPQNFFTAFIYYYFTCGYVALQSDIVFGMIYFQLLIPLVGSVAAYQFSKRHFGIDRCLLYRAKRYRPLLFQQVLKRSLLIAGTVYLSYLLFYGYTLLLVSRPIDPNMTRDLLLDVLGKSFYHDHIYLYYLLEGTVRFFLMPFIYAVFGQAIAFATGKRKLALFVPVLYYYTLTIIGNAMIGASMRAGLYVSSSVIMASGDYENISTPLILLTASIPLWIGVFLIWHKTRKAEC